MGSYLRGLKFPTHRIAEANDEELYYINSQFIIETEVNKLLELAWNADLNGDKATANLKYQAVNIYTYLMYYNIAIKKELVRKNLTIPDADVIEKYNITCVEKNLTCLGVKYGSNFLKIWNQLKSELYGEFALMEFIPTEVTQTSNN